MIETTSPLATRPDARLPAEVAPALELLRTHPRWVVASHMNPDGDTLGSAIALKQLLRSLGHEVRHFCPDPPPRNLRFLAGTEEVETTLPEGDDWAIATCDAAEIGRFGDRWTARVAAARILVVVDHHISNKAFGTHNIILPHDAATGEVVFKLFEHFGVQIDELSANALYLAIATDTGSFRYDGTSPTTHRMAAHLIECGVKPGWINQQIYEQLTRSTVVLQSLALSKLRFDVGGKVAFTAVSQALLAEAGATDEECEGIVERLRAIQGVDTAIFMRELADGRWKVSLRSKGEVDVNALAGHFGGGGHVRAAGCTVAGPPDEAFGAFVARIRETLRS
ncbi:MAG: bifunctional oligoribonuclease/PAP phosphatase NrnA [Candidatus Sericytochromatia bacterium]|nr:bifunctional oligoribonuclease/PAP phosphatase NrnA [Candidatus Tanganyikabacteria bacterium]